MIRYGSSHQSSTKLLRPPPSNSKFISVSQSLHKKVKIRSSSPSHGGINIENKMLPVYLLYKNQKFIIKCKYGTLYSELVPLLYREIMNYERKNSNKSKEECEKVLLDVLGFNTVNNNLKIDYLISIMEGKLEKSLLLNCFIKNNPIKKEINFRSNRSEENRIRLNYEIFHCLAIGGFSKVYLARSYCDGKFYAIKFIKKKEQEDEENDSSIRNEMEISSNLDHPFLIQMKEGFETKKFYCMVFEYCPGGELFYLLKRKVTLSEDHARFYFIQILLGIKYIHDKGIIYRDLKPENILIDYQGNLKIVDFGLSKKLESERAKSYSYCGSAEYMAPEMILRSGHNKSVDYYSLGALLYELVTGLPPFYCKDKKELQESIINDELTFPSGVLLSSEIKDFLSHLLSKNQKIRLGSFSGIKEIMFHPWIGKFKSENFLEKSNREKVPFPPNLLEHNFDPNELGDDEEEFSEEIARNFSSASLSNEIKYFKKMNMLPEVRNYYKIIVNILENTEFGNAVKSWTNREEMQSGVDKKNMKVESGDKENAKEGRERGLKSYHVFLKHSKSARNNISIYNTSARCEKIQNEIKERISKSPFKNSNSYCKLLPYLTKTKLYKPESLNGNTHQNSKPLPRANILKMKIITNPIEEK